MRIVWFVLAIASLSVASAGLIAVNPPTLVDIKRIHNLDNDRLLVEDREGERSFMRVDGGLKASGGYGADVALVAITDRQEQHFEDGAHRGLADVVD